MIISARGSDALFIASALAMDSFDAMDFVPASFLVEKCHIRLKRLKDSVEPLIKAGIVEGRRGVNGGYRLVSSPDCITVYDIINITDKAYKRTMKSDTESVFFYSLMSGLDFVVEGYFYNYTIKMLGEILANRLKLISG